MSYLINNAIAIYFSFSIFLSQILHTYYVKNDPAYKGRLCVGIPFIKKATVDCKFGYLSAVVVFVSSLSVLISIFNVLPPLGGLTCDKLSDYALWIFLPLFGIELVAVLTNMSATKIPLDLTAIFMIGIILYSSTIAPTPIVIVASIGAVFTPVFSFGIFWISQFQKDRLKHSSYVHIYGIPVLYYFGSLGFNGIVGSLLACYFIFIM